MNFKYFTGKISHDLTYLYISRTIVFFSNGFFAIFVPIFLYEMLGHNIQKVLLFYLIGSFLYLLPLPLTTKYIEKFSLKGSLYIATIADILFLLILGITTPQNIHQTIGIALFFITAFRLLYWLPYHTMFATFSDQNNRMREVSTFMATMHIIGIIAPLIAGVILAYASYQLLFIVGIIVYATSLIPLLSLSNVHEKFSWTYMQTWRNLCAKKYRPAMIAYVADSAESSVGTIIWPIFIFNLLNGDYMSIGMISALTIGVTVLLEMFIGRYADTHHKRKKMLKINSILYALGWLVKIFIITGFHIFLADTYHKLTKALSQNSLDAITYDLSADQGHYVDEFTVIKEMAINIGRIFLYATAMVMAIFVGLQWTFLLAAIATMLVNTIRLQQKTT
ncbi:MAG: hypothetical protein WC819_00360 [Parcubacteria group bacterium]|jgi:hypothetical protein